LEYVEKNLQIFITFSNIFNLTYSKPTPIIDNLETFSSVNFFLSIPSSGKGQRRNKLDFGDGT
jgi:hypothetical protein